MYLRRAQAMKRYLMRERTVYQRTRSAVKFLESIKTGNPCLNYCDYQTIKGTEYQIFTDKYVMFMLVDKLELPYYLDYPHGEFKYPAIERLYWLETTGIEITGLIDLNDIIYQMKNRTIHSRDIIEFHVDQATISIKAKCAKDIVDVLGTTDLQVYYGGHRKPLLFIDNKTGNKALSMVYLKIKEGE